MGERRRERGKDISRERERERERVDIEHYSIREYLRQLRVVT
jgi:hypothetical protein